MDITLLETLRYKIATSKDFSHVFEYFFDHFGEDPAFFDASEPAQDDLLVKLLGQIGGAIFKKDKVRIDALRLLRVKEYRFIHGGMLLNGAMANVIYCDDLQQGILALHRPSANASTQFVRFSAEMLAPDPTGEASKFKH